MLQHVHNYIVLAREGGCAVDRYHKIVDLDRLISSMSMYVCEYSDDAAASSLTFLFGSGKYLTTFEFNLS